MVGSYSSHGGYGNKNLYELSFSVSKLHLHDQVVLDKEYLLV